jgi:hypothetical protein
MVLPLDDFRRSTREDGAKSRHAGGDDELKFDPSRNSLKDGLFGRVHHLDDEKPEDIAAIHTRFREENQPRDATEEFLVNECAIGTVLQGRYFRAYESELQRQQRKIRQRWEEARAETAETLRAGLVAPETVDLDSIVDQLRTFGHGVSCLAGEWLRLKKAINTRGFLTPEEFNMGVRLMGVKPALDTVAQHQGAFLFTLWSACCHRLSPAGLIDTMLLPVNRPAALADLSRDYLVPDPAAARDQIIKWVNEELAELEALADRVAREVDGPELARVLNPAAIVIDPEAIKRLDRARCNYQTTFYRGKNGLEAKRKGEALAAARRPDIKPPAPDGESAARPSGAPPAATEVLGQQPDGAPGQQADRVSQNGTQTGPDRAAADRDGAGRSYHKQVAKRPVGAIVRVRSRSFGQGGLTPRQE